VKDNKQMYLIVDDCGDLHNNISSKLLSDCYTETDLIPFTYMSKLQQMNVEEQTSSSSNFMIGWLQTGQLDH
jgi:hypothetical protein